MMITSKNIQRSKHPGSLVTVLFLIGLALGLTGCDNDTSDRGTPLGPSSSASVIDISPSVANISRGTEQTFTAVGGTGAFTWTTDTTTLASINAATGVLTALDQDGTITITATDTNGATDTAIARIVGEVLIVTPAAGSLNQGETLTFTATGVDPFFWSVDDITLGIIDTDSGVFTANGSTGTATITVIDSDGNTGTATVTILQGRILMVPSDLTFQTLPSTTIAYTTTGEVGTVFFSLTGEANDYTGATIDTTTGIVTIAAMPTDVEGDQTLTITASDGIVDDGTATLTLIAPVLVTTTDGD